MLLRLKVYNTKSWNVELVYTDPDAPLVFAWLATKAYPEEFKDYPLKGENKRVL